MGVFEKPPAKLVDIYFVIFRDLIPLGYNLETKTLTEFKEILDDFFCAVFIEKNA